jgi:hypothetical protein
VVDEDSSEGIAYAEMVDDITVVSARFGQVPRFGREAPTEQLNTHGNPIEAALMLRLGKEIELAIVLVIVFLIEAVDTS